MKIVNILNKILISMILIFSISFIVSVSYSFFTSGIQEAETDTTVTIETGDMKVVYLSGPDITALNMEPSEEPFATKIFTLTGTNTFANREIWYELSLIVDENTFSTDAISYTLKGVNNAGNGKIVTDVLTRQPINNTDILLGRGNFTGSVEGGVHTYTLKIYFYETWLNQSIDLGKTFKAHIGIDEYTPVLLNNYIIGLTGTDQGTGKVVNENGYRYEGLNPNNYIRFNNELWRIIGTFDSNTHGLAGQRLVKIIRANSIGGNIIHGSTDTSWAWARLQQYLNGDYYNGLNTISKNMIETITWKLKNSAPYSQTSLNAYNSERGSPTLSAKVGLIYTSDYGYAVLSSSCARTIIIKNYNTTGCYNQNWLYTGSDYWTITQSSASYWVYIASNGSSDSKYEYFTHATHPVVYLKEKTLKMDGDGSSSNPYIIE